MCVASLLLLYTLLPGARGDNQPCKVCVYMITKLISPSVAPLFPSLPPPLLSILPFSLSRVPRRVPLHMI